MCMREARFNLGLVQCPLIFIPNPNLDLIPKPIFIPNPNLDLIPKPKPNANPKPDPNPKPTPDPNPEI